MLLTITRNLDQIPSYPTLRKLADENHVCVTGDERSGSFSGRGVEGDYEFDEAGIHCKFTALGVTGELSLEVGKAAVTITDKPFWLPETLLTQKITEGLESFCRKLAERASS